MVTVGRPIKTLTVEDIKEATKRVLEKYGRVKLTEVAKETGVSYPTFLREKQRLGLDPKAIALTPLISDLEYDNLTEDEFEEYMYSLEEMKKPESYEIFRFKFDEDIILKPIYDPHLGAPSSLYKKLWEDLKLIKNTSNVKTFLGGDYIDNFTKYSRGSAVYNQLMPPPEQKMRMEWIIKYLGKDKVLGVIQGCHDEWSKKNDDFDLGLYLANKIGVPYLGFGALLELEVGENLYKVYVSHKERYFAKANLTHGLKRHWREELDFDLGISGHRHRYDMEVFCEKGRTIKVLKCSGYKARDRFLRQEKKEKHVFRREAVVLLAEKQADPSLGIILFEDINQALRYL